MSALAADEGGVRAAFELRPLHPLFAAEVTGFDIAAPADAETIDAIGAALGHYGLLVFRDQKHVRPEEHIAFSRRFGRLEIHVQKKVPSERPS